MSRYLAITVLLMGLCASGAAFAQTNTQHQQFREARRAFRGALFEEAKSRFEAMVGGTAPTITDAELILESRKYLGATYVQLGQMEDAEQQFLLLFRQDPDWPINPIAFEEDVVQLYNTTQERVEDEIRRANLQGEYERVQRLLGDAQRRMERIEALARTETVERRPSRAIALLPFGLGQFQDDRMSAGLAFAALEGAFLAGAVAMWGWHRWLRNQPVDESDVDRFNQRERVARVFNQTLFAAFAGIVIIGIIEAQIRFRPLIQESRQRELPDDIPPEPEVELSLGAGTLRFEVRF